jgi:hypothetical protein
MLTVYDPSTATYKHYVAAEDRRIRESSDPSSPRLPAFHHVSENRDPEHHLNVFLVIINAEIKFHRYFQMTEHHSPTIPLPAGVINLMQRTMELVDLLYWEPVATEGSKGAEDLATKVANRRKNPPHTGRLKATESKSSAEMVEDDQDMQIPSGLHGVLSRRRRLRWLKDMDLETRMAYGRALMSGHGILAFISPYKLCTLTCLFLDREYDPALFEDAFPINECQCLI